ncbi:MAG: hypothetical protein ABI652_06715 [Acidobacteriota bacterium]
MRRRRRVSHPHEVTNLIVERPALERRVLASLDAGRIPVVLGGCGTGRTSLLLRLETLLGHTRSQYLDVAAAATTPERCLRAVSKVSRFAMPAPPVPPLTGGTAVAAFAALLHYFDGARGEDGAATFLLDEFLDVRTFESFPGLRHVQREWVARLADSPTRFVLASRFTARVHRLLRDAPAKFEVVHTPPVDAQEAYALALRIDSDRHDWAADVAPLVTALSGGRATPIQCLLLEMASSATSGSGGGGTDAVAALAAVLAPDGPLTARLRESYEFRLHRARGYGALKAILGVLAENEPLNLTEISHQLGRTPGSTKDYLSWLEDVDLVTSQSKRYSFEDALLRLYVRLYARPVPPSDVDILKEVTAYAAARLPQARLVSQPHHGADPHVEARSGIIEID